MHNYLRAWKKFAVCGGRATRAEYWQFFLVNILIIEACFAGIAIILGGLKTIKALWLIWLLMPLIANLTVSGPYLTITKIAFPIMGDQMLGGYAGDWLWLFLPMAYSIAIMMPYLSVTIRRLHDTNRSGWWTLVALIPLVGPFVFLYFLVQDSQPRENRYGPNPKEVTA